MPSTTITFTRNSSLDVFDYSRAPNSDLYKTVITNTIEAQQKSSITYDVSKLGWVSKTDTIVLSKDTSIDISLVQKYTIIGTFDNWNTSHRENGIFSIALDGETIYSGADVESSPNTTNIVTLYPEQLDEKAAYTYVLSGSGFDFNIEEGGVLSKEFAFTASYGNCCVPYYAKIQTPEGIIKAQDVKIGMQVLGYDEKNKTVGYATVTEIRTPKRSALASYKLENGEHFEVTLNHTLYTDHGWAAYDISDINEVSEFVQVEVGFKVFSAQEEWVEIVEIDILEFPDYVQCYDFTTSLRTFYADGYLVHNAACKGDTTPGDITLSIYSKSVHKITTPYETIYVPEGELISNYINPLYIPDSSIPMTTSITKLNGYLRDGVAFDLATATATEEITLTADVSLNIPTTSTITITCGTKTVDQNGSYDQATIKGYDSHENIGSCTQLFDTWDIYEACASYETDSDGYLSPKYEFNFATDSFIINNLYGEIIVNASTDTGIEIFNNEKIDRASHITLQNLYNDRTITQAQYNSMTGQRTITFTFALA